jgi:predicted nucleotidyltransferase
MKHGLSVSELEEIQQVFSLNDKVDKVILFGSRAMGTFKPGSDIDLAVQGDAINLNDILSMSVHLEDLGSLLSFDLLNYSSIDNPDVVDHIDRVGVILYDKSAFKNTPNQSNPILLKQSGH